MEWRNDKPTERQIATVEKYKSLGINIIGTPVTKGDYCDLIPKLMEKYRKMKSQPSPNFDFGGAGHDWRFETYQGYYGY